ncbi:hypothetical protein ACJRW5_08075 [Pseudomonas sp. SH1-B]
MRIEPSGHLRNLVQGVQRQFTAAEPTPEEVREGLRVSLSELGKQLASKSEKNQDIDDSDLPAAIKDLLKQIRELQAKIAEKQAELESVAGDRSLDDDTRRLRLDALRTELASLNAALTSANATLIKLMHENGLSNEQMTAVASLAMP